MSRRQLQVQTIVDVVDLYFLSSSVHSHSFFTCEREKKWNKSNWETRLLVFTVTRTNSKNRGKVLVCHPAWPDPANRFVKILFNSTAHSKRRKVQREWEKHFAASNAVGQLSWVCNKVSGIIGSGKVRSLALQQVRRRDRCKCKEIAI